MMKKNPNQKSGNHFPYAKPVPVLREGNVKDSLESMFTEWAVDCHTLALSDMDFTDTEVKALTDLGIKILKVQKIFRRKE